jgi:3-hydroxyacyl-[acyl-carrier-protein] dehydratase
MRFVLVDRLVKLDPGQTIVAEKALTLAEEYLGDHFPSFPVMPGVLMVEAMVQSAAWLVRASTDFAYSVIVLRRARNITYKSFVPPGRILRVEVAARALGSTESEFEGTGWNDDQQMVKARFTLSHYNLADREPGLAAVDQSMIDEYRRQFAILGGPALLAAGMS